VRRKTNERVSGVYSTLKRTALKMEENHARVGAVASLRETLRSVLDGADDL
jgi:hypothetical protein